MADTSLGTDPGYEGWRVAVAASVGVFVSFASLLVYTFGVLLVTIAAFRPAASGAALIPES